MNKNDINDPDNRIVVLVNDNVRMSPGKMAAQAVHAALYLAGVPHGTVVVLGAKKSKILEVSAVTINDGGLTEIERGTLTCGAYVERNPNRKD